MELFTDLINSYLHEPYASLLNGILLGRPLFVTNSFYTKLKIVGLIHIVVLSGMNITMLSAIVMNLIVKFVGRKLSIVITVAFIFAFIIFVGIEPPVVRAAVMGILTLIGLMFGRKTLALYTLFISSVLMIIVWPEWLSSISFQLSFAATLGIILFGNMNEDKIEGTHEILKYIQEELRISIAAQIFTLPIIFYYFRQISFVSPVANILVSWTIAPIMILGMATIFLGLINWQLGFILSWICYGLIHIIITVVEILAKIPYASIQF